MVATGVGLGNFLNFGSGLGIGWYNLRLCLRLEGRSEGLPQNCGCWNKTFFTTWCVWRRVERGGKNDLSTINWYQNRTNLIFLLHIDYDVEPGHSRSPTIVIESNLDWSNTFWPNLKTKVAKRNPPNKLLEFITFQFIWGLVRDDTVHILWDLILFVVIFNFLYICVLAASLEISVISNPFLLRQATHESEMVTCCPCGWRYMSPGILHVFLLQTGQDETWTMQIRFHSWTVFLFSLLEMVLTWVDCTAFNNWVAGSVLKHLNQSSIPIGGLFSCNRFGNCSCFWSRFVIRSFSLNPRGLLRSPNVKKVRANIGLHVLQYYRHRLCPRDLTNCNERFFSTVYVCVMPRFSVFFSLCPTWTVWAVSLWVVFFVD